MMQCLIWPLRFICVRIAAVTVHGIFSAFTFSTAAKNATFGVSVPSARETATAESIMSIKPARSGAILIAASVTMSNL